MSTSKDNMLQTVRDFKDQQIPRDQYWAQMQEFHVNLEQYSDLVRQADLERIEISGDGMYIVLKNGLKLRWLPQDIRTVPNILINHAEYEAEELSIITQLVRSCKVVFDIGANIGWYSLHIAQAIASKGGKVYGFEPVPGTFAELSHNVAVNDYGHTIHVNNIALSEVAGTLKFYVPAFTGSVAASPRALFPDDANQIVECQVTTLDDFVAREGINRLDLIKCDVEGSELFVLRGGLKTIEKRKPIIMLEMLRKWAKVFDYHPNDIIALLKLSGYHCWVFDGEQFIKVLDVDETCTHTNFFFLHETRHNDLLSTLGRKSNARATISNRDLQGATR